MNQNHNPLMGTAILLNAPKRAGKDTTGLLLQGIAHEQDVKFKGVKFTEPLDAGLKALLGLSPEQYAHIREAEKDTPMRQLGGRTIREWLMHVSETTIKPVMGKQHFGTLCGRKVRTCLVLGSLVVATDSGFQEEAEGFAREVGLDRCVQIRIHRKGTQWDSRSYWRVGGMRSAELHNDGTIEELDSNLRHVLVCLGLLH